jgi:ABC-type multidrug transport system fused ATPase/permease subunit
MGVVSLDSLLFNESLLYNIAYGRAGDAGGVAAVEREAAEAAAKAARIHDFILTLPGGYDTKVGERGLKLSGGEKQRIAIARAILKNPAILILDVATSALDSITEAEVQAAINAARADRTVLVIAHRLSTIRDADTILVLDKGIAAESGKHEELLAIPGGKYAAMWAQQAAMSTMIA